MIKIFQKENTQEIIRNFTRALSKLEQTEEVEAEKNKHIEKVLNHIISNPKIWDELCQVSLGSVGDQLLDFLKVNENELSVDYLDLIYALIFRFILEFEISTKSAMIK